MLVRVVKGTKPAHLGRRVPAPVPALVPVSVPRHWRTTVPGAPPLGLAGVEEDPEEAHIVRGID